MAKNTGKPFGQYVVYEEIAHGGMGNVYRGVQPSIGREVAIKVLSKHFLQDSTFLERFKREVQLITKLKHPRILPVHDYGEHDGQPYIVMAYIEAGTLADQIAGTKGGLPLDETTRLVRQIAEGLDYAHGKKIIHRDFKPGNVLLDADGNVYLADFGLAKASEDSGQLTASGAVGTPAYMAPEMTREGGLSPLIDVYALGVTVFQMLTSRLPYQADTPVGLLAAHAIEPIPSIRKLRADLPEEAEDFIQRAMAKQPGDRYHSTGDLAEGLAQALGFAPQTPTGQRRTTTRDFSYDPNTEPIPRSTPSSLIVDLVPKLSRWGWLGIGAAVVAMIGIAWWLLSSIPLNPAAAPTTPADAETDPPTATVSGNLTADQRALIDEIGSSGTLALSYNPSLSSSTNLDIYTVQTNGRNLSRLTINDTNDYAPVWSPDGSKILFNSTTADGSSGELWVIDANGLNSLRLMTDVVPKSQASYSPDGAKIAFTTMRDGNSEIYVMNADGSNPVNITRNSSVDEQPSWSPDGSRIAFITNRIGGKYIYTTNPSDTFETFLTSISGDAALSVVWSPDGSFIGFVFSKGNGFQAQIINSIDRTEQSRIMFSLINYGKIAPHIAWSPDGKYVAYIDLRNELLSLYFARSDGSVESPAFELNCTDVALNLCVDGSVAWKPGN